MLLKVQVRQTIKFLGPKSYLKELLERFAVNQIHFLTHKIEQVLCTLLAFFYHIVTEAPYKKENRQNGTDEARMKFPLSPKRKQVLDAECLMKSPHQILCCEQTGGSLLFFATPGASETWPCKAF